MKSKYFTLIIIFCMLFLSLNLILNVSCIAQKNRAEVSFLGEPTYELVNKLEKNTIIAWTYSIDVTLQNTGNKKSDELLVNLSIKGDSIKQKVIVEPENTSTVTFTWPFFSDKDQKFNVNFYPVDMGTPRNVYNSGKTSFTLIIEEADGLSSTSTPGFEIILFIASLIIIISLLKKKQK